MARPSKQIAFQLVAAAIVAISISACGGGGGGSGRPGPGNRAPLAANDAIRADDAALERVDVLANDEDPDGDPLTVTIQEAPFVGTASVNDDGTVRIADLPGGFKGLTRVKYRATDPSGESTEATAAIFVGADPFRAVFAGDPAADGAAEVYIADFVSTPQAVTAATEGNFRLRGFVAADNGSTIVYRREDTTAPTTTDLSFVTMTDAGQQVRIALPGGAVPVLDAQGNDQFRVSPDGQWIAAVGGDGNVEAIYVLNIADAAVITKVSPEEAVRVALPRFSHDSQALYFLASTLPGGGNKSLYLAALSDPGGTTALISAAPAPGSDDDVRDYLVALDQSRILLEAKRNGRVGLFFVDPAHIATEVQLNHPLLPTETMLENTVSLAPRTGPNALGQRISYTTQTPVTFSTYVAEISATPNPRLVATLGARMIGFRPDEAALLYSRGGQVSEAVIDSGTADQVVGGGTFGWYDSTGNIVLLKQFLPYPALAVAVRGSFGSTQPLGTAVLAAQFINVTGIDRAVTIIGEGPTDGPAPTSARLALVDALAPDKLLYLADFESPLELTSDSAQIVSY